MAWPGARRAVLRCACACVVVAAARTRLRGLDLGFGSLLSRRLLGNLLYLRLQRLLLLGREPH